MSDDVTRYAYAVDAFGGRLRDDPAALMHDMDGASLNLARGVMPVALTMDAETGRLSRDVVIGAQGFAVGDVVRSLWVLEDRDKRARIAAVEVVSEATGAAVMVLTCGLPLTPGGTYCFKGAGATSTARLPGGIGTGARILTDAGKRPIEAIVAGDAVWTATAGFQPVLWRGGGERAGQGLRVRRGWMGATADLVFADDHRIGLPGAEGDPPVTATASVLPEAGLAERDGEGGDAVFHNILLAAHHLIFANGVLCETLWAGGVAGAGTAKVAGGAPAGWPDDPGLARMVRLPVVSRDEALARLRG